METHRRKDRTIWELTVTDQGGEETTFRTTYDHPWWIPEMGWVRTMDLAPGAKIETASGEEVVVSHVLQTEAIEPTYNLNVAEFHTYFVGEDRVWVHNDNCGTPDTTEMHSHLSE